jgi:hypothetical protein
MKIHKKMLFTLLTASTALATASTDAAVLGEWTFNTGATTTDRMASSNNAAGVTVSNLMFNDSFEDFGPGAVPNDANDGIGFGGNSGQEVMFLHRANYFDGGAPAGKWTSFGNGTQAGTGADLSSNGNAPFAFTVTAGASETVTVESLSVDWLTSADIIFQFQEAGESVGSSVTFNGGNPSGDVLLTSPVVIGPGETKTFSFNVNSGALDTKHLINAFGVNGTVIPEPGSLALLGLGGLLIARRRRG